MPASWTVTAVQETTDLTDSGQAAKGNRVTFQLADGTFGSVFLPGASFTPDAVKAAIAVKAATLEAVKGLTGP
jgi:hypothetical protein